MHLMYIAALLALNFFFPIAHATEVFDEDQFKKYCQTIPISQLETINMQCNQKLNNYLAKVRANKNDEFDNAEIDQISQKQAIVIEFMENKKNNWWNWLKKFMY